MSINKTNCNKQPNTTPEDDQQNIGKCLSPYGAFSLPP